MKTTTRKFPFPSRCIALILALLTVLPCIISIVPNPASAAEAAAANFPRYGTDVFPCYGTVVGSNQDGKLKFRAEANTSSDILEELSDNTVVVLLGKSGNWYRAIRNGKEGYLHSAYIKLGRVGIVINSNQYGKLRARSGPGTDYSELFRIKDGTPITIWAPAQDGWYPGTYNNSNFYVSATYISFATQQVSSEKDNVQNKEEASSNTNGTITASSLNVRTGPGTEYTAIGTVYRNDRVQILSKENGWFWISYPDHDLACVSAKYVKVDAGVKIPESSSKTRTGYVTTGKLNVRTGPGVWYKDIGDVYFCTELVIVGEEKGWYKIQYNGEIHDVFKGYVETDPDELCGMAQVVSADIVCAYASRSAKNSNISTRVVRGAVLQVLTTYSNGWAKVEANGLTCFIQKKYLDFLSYEEYSNLPKGEVKSGTTIASYSTSFAGKHAGAVANIKTAASLLNGIVVNPGETFDYYGITHPRGLVYEEAPIIINGEYSTSRGGGLCQDSSTIFAAIMAAEEEGVQTGLNITARFPHSKAVGYVPVRYEAAISSYYQTFSFRNTNTYPVKIIAETSNNTLTIKIVKV